MAIDVQDTILTIEETTNQIDLIPPTSESEQILLIEKPLRFKENDAVNGDVLSSNQYKIAIPELPIVFNNSIRNKKILYLSHIKELQGQYFEALKYEFDLKNTNDELIGPLTQLSEITNNRLWTWTYNFELLIIPPPSRMKTKYGFQENESNIFIKPLVNSDELRQLAMGQDGRQKRLSAPQIKEIAKTGTFSVESQNFEGAIHVWRLTHLLQKGTEPANDSLRSDLSHAFYVTFLFARDRLIGKIFSIRDAICHLGYAVYFLYNLFIGASWKTLTQSEKTILAEFQLGQLLEDVEPNDPEQLKLCLLNIKEHNLEQKLEAMSKLNKNKIIEVLRNSPFIYKTGADELINLLRVCPSFTNSIDSDKLRDIFTQVNLHLKDQFSDEYLRNTLIQYQKEGFADDDIVANMNADYNKTYLTHLIKMCQSNEEFLKAFPGIGADDISIYFRALVIFDESVREHKEIKETYVKEQLALTETKATIRSKCQKWLKEQRTALENRATKDFPFLKILKANLTEQLADNDFEWKYFIDRCESFTNTLPKTRSQILKKKLAPHKTFTFNRHIWNPKNQVFDTKTGKSYNNVKIIEDAHSTLPVSSNSVNRVYKRETSVEYTVTTNYPFWRFRNFFISSFTWFSNVLYAVIIGIILFGPLSISALLLWKPFSTGFRLDKESGNLIVSKRTETLVSRVGKFWNNIRQRYQIFQAKPDTGFIGKNLSRLFVVFYLFFILGFIGTILFVSCFVFLCIFMIIIGIFLLIFIWMWYPFVVVLILLIRLIIYDWNYIDTTKNTSNSAGSWFPIFYFLIYKIIIRVILQFVISLFLALISPLLSFIIVVGAIIRRFLRLMWDKLMLICVVKARGRVPIINSFIARRISGPGLAAHYYYQISPSQALVQLEYVLESLELELYNTYILELIEMPKKTLKLNFYGITKPMHLRYELSTEGTSMLDNITANLKTALKTALEIRRKSFKLESYNVNSNLIKMTRENLDQTLALATSLTKEFYTSYLFQYVTDTNYNYLFEKHGFVVDDWPALAKFHLASAFSNNLLTPLEDCDQSFKLQVKNMTFSSYINNIELGLAHHDLSAATPDYQDIPFLHRVQLTSRYNLEWLKEVENKEYYMHDEEISHYHLQDLLTSPAKIALFKIQSKGLDSILNGQYPSKQELGGKINEGDENVDDKPSECDVLLS